MRWLVLLFMGMALSGCAGSDDAPDAAMDHGAGHQAQHMMQNVTFFDMTYGVAQSFAGAFAAQDHPLVQPVVGAAGQPVTNVQTHDVTALIPAGIPVFVRIELDAPAGTYAWLGTDDFAAIWTSDCGACEAGTGAVGSSWSGAVQNTGQSFWINVWNNQGGFRNPNEYDVAINVTAAPDRIPSGVVVEVELPGPGSHILFEAVEGTMPDVMVFDPNDVYVTTLPGGDSAEMFIEDDMATGAYVFLPMGHGDFYRLRSGSDVAADESLNVQARILKQVIQTGGTQPAGEAGSMTVDMPVQPLQTGLLMFGGLSNGASIETRGPGGFNLRVEAAGPAFGFAAFTQTPMGHDGLRPGEYTISWEAPGNDGSVQVQEFFTLYGR